VILCTLKNSPFYSEIITVLQVMDHYNAELDIHVHMTFILLPIMVSCWIRDLKYLVPLSLFANFAMTAGIAVTLYYISQDLPAPSTREYIAPWTKIPLFFGTAIYSFEGIGLVCLVWFGFDW
jgi:proton-coupled amino acid transporter